MSMGQTSTIPLAISPHTRKNRKLRLDLSQGELLCPKLRYNLTIVPNILPREGVIGMGWTYETSRVI